MSSAFTTVALCFVSFILGQLFEACIHPGQTEYLVVHSCFSFTTLVSLVVLMLIFHDALVLLFLLRPLTSNSSPKRCLESLAAAAANAVPDRRVAFRLLPADPPVAPTGSPDCVRRNLSLFKVVPRKALLLIEYSNASPASLDKSITNTGRMVIRVQRPFWRLSVFGSGAARSLIEYKTLLAPVIKISSTLAPCTSGLSGIQDIASFASLLDIGLDLKEDSAEQVEDSALAALLGNEARAAQATPAPARASQVSLLRHVAAVALLRRLGFRIEEPSSASIEEVADDYEDEQIAQVGGTQNAVKEIMQVDKAAEKEAETVSISSKEELKIDAEGEQTQNDIEVALQVTEPVAIRTVEKEEPESRCVDAPKNDTFPADDQAAPLYDELDLPSYEQFVRDLPMDPLLAQTVTVPAYAVHQPPSLSILAARSGTPPCRTESRPSRIHFLARLSARVVESR
ncbi:hypothetical protein DFH06DRAFT_1462711 [Mycena polygramma]|nr:hypothetical protein DFH06DRAFT_1462711 [Mycena polygramma]